jgi:phosphoglucosamine mutase
VSPDGLNINDGCGSTHLDSLRTAVLEHGADAGIAHDGDADRCLAVDADGEVVDGDQILAVLARELAEEGRLADNTVVATVMSNLGFRRAMADAGIEIVETAVGDRYLIEAMRAGKYVLGGEQSGHIIMFDHATTGDGEPLAELASLMTRYPQVLVNVRGVDKARVSASEEVSAVVAGATTELGSSGRVLVRPSGTEPAVRVMVEAVHEQQARQLAERIAAVVRSAG